MIIKWGIFILATFKVLYAASTDDYDISLIVILLYFIILLLASREKK